MFFMIDTVLFIQMHGSGKASSSGDHDCLIVIHSVVAEIPVWSKALKPYKYYTGSLQCEQSEGHML